MLSLIKLISYLLENIKKMLMTHPALGVVQQGLDKIPIQQYTVVLTHAKQLVYHWHQILIFYSK